MNLDGDDGYKVYPFLVLSCRSERANVRVWAACGVWVRELYITTLTRWTDKYFYIK